jgi:predicted DNA-binding transcriptional regulator YafY
MRRDEDMRTGVGERAPGSHREYGSQLRPAVQMTFDQVRLDTTQQDQRQLRALFCAMVTRFGGVDALCAALDRKPSYVSKIVEAMNGEDGRAVQLEWLAPMLRDPRCAELLLEALSDLCGFAPPQRDRVLSEQETKDSAFEVVREMDGITKEAIRQAIAKRKGVRVDDVKL